MDNWRSDPFCAWARFHDVRFQWNNTPFIEAYGRPVNREKREQPYTSQCYTCLRVAAVCACHRSPAAVVSVFSIVQSISNSLLLFKGNYYLLILLNCPQFSNSNWFFSSIFTKWDISLFKFLLFCVQIFHSYGCGTTVDLFHLLSNANDFEPKTLINFLFFFRGICLLKRRFFEMRNASAQAKME